jgi:hypothetical protein
MIEPRFVSLERAEASASTDLWSRVRRAMRAGKVRLLYHDPGRALNEPFRSFNAQNIVQIGELSIMRRKIHIILCSASRAIGCSSIAGLVVVAIFALSAVGAATASAECGRLKEAVKPSWDTRNGGFQGRCEDKLADNKGAFVRVSVVITYINSEEACAEVEESKTGDFKNGACTEKVGEEEGEYVLIVPPKCSEKEEEEEDDLISGVTRRGRQETISGLSDVFSAFGNEWRVESI